MKKYRTKPEDAKAYGIFKPIVTTLFWLSIFGTGLSYLSEWYALYHSTAGNVFQRSLTATLTALVIDGGLRLSIFVSAYMLFEVFKDFKWWKLIMLLVGIGAVYYLFNQSLSISIEGTDKYALKSTEKPDSILPNNTSALLLDEEARNQFLSDSLATTVRINAEFAKNKKALKNKRRAAIQERKRYQNADDYDPTSKWFADNIKAQTRVVSVINETLKGWDGDKVSAKTLAIDSLRAIAIETKTVSIAMQRSNQDNADSLNTANHSLYISKLASKKSKYINYVWASLIMGILHALSFFAMLYVSGSEIKFEFTDEDEIELEDLGNQLSNALRFRWYNVRKWALSPIIGGEIEIKSNSLSVKMAETSPTPPEDNLNSNSNNLMSDFTAPKAFTPISTAKTLPTQGDNVETNVQSSSSIRKIGFRTANETGKDLGSQEIKEIKNGVGEELKAFKAQLLRMEEANKKFKLEAKEREERLKLKMEDEAKLRQENETLKSKIKELETVDETETPPKVIVQKETTNRVETVSTFEATSLKRDLKKYVDRFRKSWTEAKHEFIVKSISDLVHHGYEVTSNWSENKFDVSRKPQFQIGECKAEVVIQHNEEEVQDLKISITKN